MTESLGRSVWCASLQQQFLLVQALTLVYLWYLLCTTAQQLCVVWTSLAEHGSKIDCVVGSLYIYIVYVGLLQS